MVSCSSIKQTRRTHSIDFEDQEALADDEKERRRCGTSKMASQGHLGKKGVLRQNAGLFQPTSPNNTVKMLLLTHVVAMQLGGKTQLPPRETNPRQQRGARSIQIYS